MYAYYDDKGKLALLAGAHVDDIIWAASPEYDAVITEHLFKHLQLNQVEEGSFRFCGRECSQLEEYSVYITCNHNIEKPYR